MTQHSTDTADISPRLRPRLAPNWLQVFLIFGLLGAAIFVMLNGRFLWSVFLYVGAAAFGGSYLLRRMVGDDYDRT